MCLIFKKISTTIYLSTLIYLSSIFEVVVYADPIGPGGGINPDMENFKAAMSQWGTTFTGSAALLAAIIAVSSIFIPWDFYKAIGRKAWGGLITAVVIYIVLSFFGNSIHQYLISIFGCALGIIGASCG